MMQFRVVIALPFLLAACESATMERYNAINLAINTTIQESNACYMDLYNSHPSNPVFLKILYTDNDPMRIGKLSSKEVATDQERIEIINYYNDASKCRKIEIEGYPPATHVTT